MENISHLLNYLQMMYILLGGNVQNLWIFNYLFIKKSLMNYINMFNRNKLKSFY